MVNALFAKLRRVAQVVAVVGVAPIDDHIPGLEHLGQLADGAVGDVARRDHHPGRPRLLELGREVSERIGPHCAVGGKRLHGVLVDVVADAAVAVAHEAPDDPRAHPPQSDHSQLHRRVGGHLVPLGWILC